jgi:hypothetical protein
VVNEFVIRKKSTSIGVFTVSCASVPPQAQREKEKLLRLTSSLVFFGISFLVASSAYAKVDGAVVQTVVVDAEHGVVLITVLNQSEKPIEFIQVMMTQHYADGHIVQGGSGEGGPRLIAPNETFTMKSLQNPTPVTVEATVDSVIYSDGTAETNDPSILGSERESVRTRILRGFLQSDEFGLGGRQALCL